MNKVETFKDFGKIPAPKEFSEFCEFTSSELGNRGEMSQSDGTKYLASVLTKADKSWQELNIPAGIKIDVKLVELALCEFSKYVRFSAQGVGNKKYKSRSHLDKNSKCHPCLQSTDPTTSKMLQELYYCIFCNRPVQESCKAGDKKNLEMPGIESGLRLRIIDGLLF